MTTWLKFPDTVFYASCNHYGKIVDVAGSVSVNKNHKHCIYFAEIKAIKT